VTDTKITQLTELAATPAIDDQLEIVDTSDTSGGSSGTNKRIQWTNIAGAFVATATFNDHSARHDPGGADALTTASASTIQPDDSAAEGSAASLSRSDHKHAIVAASPGTIQPDASAAEGTATSFARSDHTHAIVAAAASTLAGTSAEGTSTSFARADHDHALPWTGIRISPCVPVSAPASSATGATNTYYVVEVHLWGAGNVTGIKYRVGATSNGNVRSGLFDSSGTQLAVRTSNVAQGTANQFQNVGFDGVYAAAPARYLAVLWFTSATATWFGARQLLVLSTGTDASGVPASISPVPTVSQNADYPQLTLY
jgi:hypothetical protein